MAWGYWSATSVSDRGRSPRREKDKQYQQYQSLHPHQHQQQQQQQSQQMHQTQTELQQSTYAELGAGAGCAGTVVEEPPCSMMIQGGSFYSYSAATAAAAAAAAAAVGGRRVSAVVEGPSSSTTMSTGIQVLPRERGHVRPSVSTYPPHSPDSGDSAEYEQPIASGGLRGDITPPRGGTPHDDMFAQPGTSSSSVSRPRPPPCDIEAMEELTETEFEDLHNAELIYAARTGIGGSATCRVHGPCGQPLPEPSSSMSSLLDESALVQSQFQFNEITWGRWITIRHHHMTITTTRTATAVR